MNVLLIGMGAIISVFLMYFGITLMKKVDDEHGLPENVGIFYMLITAIVSCITIAAFYPYFFLSVLFTAYLAIMAYTDFYVMKLYTIFHIVIGMIGYITLFILGELFVLQFISVAVVIILMKWFKIINAGDVELLFASFPYICLFADIYKINKLYFCLIFLTVIMLISVVINLKAFIKKEKTKAPFAVPVFIGYVVMALLMVEK